MDAIEGIGPAVVLCPALAPDTGPPSWAARLEHALQSAGVAVIHPQQRGSAEPEVVVQVAGDPPPRASDDRLTVAGWVADLSVAITAAGLARPLLLVVTGAAARGLPALGLSQRASRHNVVGYVIVDAEIPHAGRSCYEWPDAPVLYVRSTGAGLQGRALAKLRGWTTVHGDPVDAVLALALAWPDPAS